MMFGSYDPTKQEGGNIAAFNPPKPQKKIRVIHRTSLGQLGALFFDTDVPDDFSLPMFVTSIRGVGYLLHEHLYIPLDEIAGILVWTEDKPPCQMNVLQFPEKKA